MARTLKFKRRPNNTGTVIKLSGIRRKPYCARITASERDILSGRKKQISIGTFETREEALNALSLYSLKKLNKINDIEAEEIAPDLFEVIQKKTNKKIPTFYEIYQILENEEFSKLSLSSKRGYASWVKHFEKIFNRKINTITLADLQFIFDNEKSSNGTQAHMKVLCSKIFEYAVIHQFINKDNDYTSYIKTATYKQSSKHFSFSMEEIQKLKDINTPEAHIMLIYILTGLRTSELLNIKKENIYINVKCDDDGVERVISYLITGSKTEAGKNRIVPIHDDIKQYVIDELLKDGNRVIDCNYSTFNNKVFAQKINKLFNDQHTMHDTRVTFASLCQLYKVDVYARKKILGHKLKDITFDIYTDASKNRLWTEVNKIRI